MQNDLISRSALMKRIAHHTVHDSLRRISFSEANAYEKTKGDMFNLVKDAPTIDAVPVVHARLEGDNWDYKCSACRTGFHDDIFWIQGDRIAPKHCPECGARWTEVANEQSN